MSKLKSFKTGINLDPVSADPSSPAEGDLQYSDGTVRAKGLWQYKDGAWAEIGSGGGGLDTFLAEDFSSNDSSSLTSGQNATFDNGGTLGGALADEEASQIAGDRSIKYTTDSTPGNSTNDFFYLSTITLDDKQKGNDVGLTFYYTWDGSDDLIEVVIYDDTNNTVLSSSLDLIKAKSNPTRFSTTAFIPESCNAIKVGFHHTGTSEASKVLVFDDVELSTNPFVYKNLSNNTEWESYTPTTQGLGTVSNVDVRYRRDGQHLIMEGSMTAGTVTTDELQIGLPSGLTVDSNLPNTIAVGNFSRTNSTTVSGFQVIVTGGDSFINLTVNLNSTYSLLTANQADEIIASSETFTWSARVPIEGWKATSEHVVTPAKSNLTDWIDYTPTTNGLGTVTFQHAQYKRIGDTLLISVKGTTGTVTASEMRVGLPSINGVQCTAAGNENNTGEIVLNGFLVRGSVAATEAITVISTRGDSYFNFGIQNGASNNGFTSGINGNTIIGSSAEFGFTATIRIQEFDSNATFLAAVPTNTIEEKTLSSTVSSTGDVSDLTFTGLEIGKWYHLTGQLSFSLASGTNGVRFRSASGGTGTGYSRIASVDTADTKHVSVKFKAVSTTLYTNYYVASGSLGGDGTADETFLQLEKLKYTKDA
jgi:hypothetical protein